MRNRNTDEVFKVFVEPIVRTHFFRPDLTAMRAVYAAIAAHDLNTGPPVWPMLVTPPGSAKTTTFEPLEVLPNVTAIDRLTPNTFLSGQITQGPRRRRPPSLLHRIGESGVLLFPDFSTVLSMKPDNRASVLSDLRRIYDGHLHKETGTDEKPLDWRGRLTVAVAVTPEIDRYHSVFESLGARFTIIRAARAGGDDAGEEAAMAAMDQDPQEVRDDLEIAVTVLFNDLPDGQIQIRDDLRQQIAALAEFAVCARTPVARERSNKKELLYIPDPEASTRLAQQLSQLARGSARLDRRTRVSATDIALVRRVGVDCIPNLRWLVLNAALTGRSASSGNIPPSTFHYAKEDLKILRLMDGSGALSPRAARLLTRARVHTKPPTNVNEKKGKRKRSGR